MSDNIPFSEIKGIVFSRIGAFVTGVAILTLFLTAAPRASDPPSVLTATSASVPETHAAKWAVPIYDVDSLCQDTEASDAKAAAENPELQQLADSLSGGEAKTPARRREITNQCIGQEQDSYNRLKGEPTAEVQDCLTKVGQPRWKFYTLTSMCIDAARKAKYDTEHPAWHQPPFKP